MPSADSVRFSTSTIHALLLVATSVVLFATDGVEGFVVVVVGFATRAAIFRRTPPAILPPPQLQPSSKKLQQLHRCLFAQQRRASFSSSPALKEQRPPMNEEINAKELRVVAPNPKGKDIPLGIMSLSEALTRAKEMGDMDLIMINDKSDPPVCKIVDYSKYRYMLEKKAKEVKKNSKATEVKEVKMSYKIDVHDYDVRKKNAYKFLKQGNRVKCTVMFRGREVQYEQLGAQLLEKLAVDLESVCLREGKAKREGRQLSMILSPRAEVLKAVNENRKAEEKAKKMKKAEAFLKETNLNGKGVFAIGSSAEEDLDGIGKISGDGMDDEDDEDNDQSLEELLGSDELSDLFI